MTNPKRASMREGPLAALFRKTEGEESADAEPTPESGALDGAPQSQTPAAREEHRGAPHPALSADATPSTDAAAKSRSSRAGEASSRASVPTPKDRLKQAFVRWWQALRPVMLAREAVIPRIWST